MRARLPLLLTTVLLLAAGLAVVSPGAGAAGTLRVSVLSNRADLVSAGDALVSVSLPRDVRVDKVRVTVGGREVTRAFALRPNGRYEGLVTGLRVGASTLRATAPGYAGEVVITNHPNGGPVFAGPQTEHYVCQSTARDDLCNQPATYTFLYKSTNPLKPGLQPYDRSARPTDVAMTTTDRGVTVPFIVRQETGYQARDQYTILTLFQPGRSWRPWAPQRQWNHKLLITHGGSCGASLTPGEAPLGDLSGTIPSNPAIQSSYELALGRGFAVASTALDNTGHNCNLVTAAESLVMVKERLVERYGTVRYTIGTGCSGGSIAEQTIANAYPGVYQGLVTGCTYPDAMSTAAQFADLHLLRLYFEDPSRWAPGVLWSPTQFGDVEGHLSHLNAVTSDELFFKAAVNPSEPCPGSKPTVAGDPGTLYDATTNPAGVRCSVPEMMKNALGPRPPASWTAAEKAAGHGFAGLPVGNVGIMYGLRALEKGLILPAQFVDLNVKVGGLDIDGKATAERLPGDRQAVRNAFRTGLVNEFQNVSGVPIINHGGPDPGAAHDYAHAFWVEERLQRSQGHTENRVMWFGPTPLIGDPSWATEALLKMDRWLTAVERDRRSIPLDQKVASDRPADVTDRCADVAGIELVSGPDGPLCQSSLLQTHLGTPRTVAGGDDANDHNICVLEPLVRSEIRATFTDAQWAQLQEAFPDGVCDWARPGVGQALRNQTWLTYSGENGAAIYGGANLARRPAYSQTGWTSPAFRSLLDQ
jgi:hypothetical protein